MKQKKKYIETTSSSSKNKRPLITMQSVYVIRCAWFLWFFSLRQTKRQVHSFSYQKPQVAIICVAAEQTHFVTFFPSSFSFISSSVPYDENATELFFFLSIVISFPPFLLCHAFTNYGIIDFFCFHSVYLYQSEVKKKMSRNRIFIDSNINKMHQLNNFKERHHIAQSI